MIQFLLTDINIFKYSNLGTIKYNKDSVFSPIYAINMLSKGTYGYDISMYPPSSMLLIFYANGGMSIVDIWGNSYVLSEIHSSLNGVTIKTDFENKKFIVTVPNNATTNLIIFRLK